jgi:hypothetical protein
LIACAVLAAAGATAASASGLAARLIDVIDAEPAPARVHGEIDLQTRRKAVVPWFQELPESGAIASKARGVLAIETSVGPVYLWAAPTRRGGFCHLIDIEANTLPDGSPNLAGACGPQRPRSDRPFVAGPVHSSTFTARGDLRLLHGRVSRAVASVHVRFAHGGVATIRPANGFFLRELAHDEEPTIVIARDASGTELGRRPLPGPRSFRRELPFPNGPYRKVTGIRTSAGFPMTFAVAPGTNGSVCERTSYRGGQAWGCGTGPTRLEADEIGVHRGLWNEHENGSAVALLQGSVGRAITRLEVWYKDGSATQIPIVERYVLFEVPRGRTPRLLVGLDEDGAIVSRRQLR